MQFIFAALSGLIFIFPDISILGLISFIPLLKMAENNNFKFRNIFFFELIFNLTFNVYLLYMYPLDFLGVNRFFSLLCVLTAYLFISLYEAFIFSGFIFIYRKYIKNIYIFPIFYGIFEFLNSLGFLGYTFNSLYLPFYKYTHFIKSAGIFSPYFITVVILYVNLFIYKMIRYKKFRYMVYMSVLLICNFCLGMVNDNLIKLKNKSVNISLIQGNISLNEKWFYKNIYEIIDNYKLLSEDTVLKSDIVVWPEAILPVSLDQNSNIINNFKNYSKEKQVNLISGAFLKKGEKKITNSIISFDKGKINESMYNKRHLIPLAETYPLSNITKGRGEKIISTDFGNIGCLICIDSCYPYLIYDTKRMNPDYILTVTNDGWFKNSHLYELHLAHNVYASIISRKYFLQCSNDGITCVISPKGKIIKKIPCHKGGYLFVELKY